MNDDVGHYFYILIHTIRFAFKPTMKVNIHNQCSDIKLTNQSDFSAFISWYKDPDDEVDAGSMTSASLTPQLAAFEGVLTYQLQRKSVKSDDQPESTYTLLFVAWKSEGYRNLHVVVKLIECDKQIMWNYTKVKEYYRRHVHQLNIYTSPIKYTWLTRNGVVLMTRLELDFTQRDGVLNIVVSKGIRDEHTRRPTWINLKR
jgi:hypothetical protein